MIRPFAAIASIMNLLWIFLALCPVGLVSLIGFAAHIDPLSGRWRALKPWPERGAWLRERIAFYVAVIACSESPSSGS
ncbi:hypothetical protein AWB68_05694 [Caballeronia choica]|uniref:Uncharacterized protein n=2 Tax=Caballeronia choica TaxID=326476 RepID=A0A158KGZ0_9BURK|nr:hypothetical protein AWB68_05694 [Caballeronia choica]